METLSFEPLIPSTLWVLLALAGAAALAFYAFRVSAGLTPARRITVLLLMATVCAVPLVILLNPIWIRRIPPPRGKPRLTILIDRSASMATADAEDGQTRYQAAARLASACAAQLTDRFEVRVQAFSERVSPVAPDSLASMPPDGQMTDLAAAMTESLAQPTPSGQAVLLLSDGIHNAGSTAGVLTAAQFARAANAPIYTRTFGGERSSQDLQLDVEAPQQLAFVDQTVPITARLKQFGMPPRRVNVVLEHAGRVVDRREVLLERGRETGVEFDIRRSERGMYRYDLRVDPVPGEVTSVNNFASFQLRVVDEPIRVLLLEGKPYWDAKFLMRTLAADPSLSLECVIRLSDDRLLWRSLARPNVEPSTGVASGAPGSAEAEPSPPVVARHEELTVVTDPASVLGDLDKLREYQAIVLGRSSESFLSEQALKNLRTWISRDSGALVCYRGQPTTEVTQELDRLLPVRWAEGTETRFRVRPTYRGRDLSWIGGTADETGSLSALPSLSTATAPGGLKPLTVVLATADAEGDAGQAPVVSYQPYGAGRVVVIEGAGMWRWAFLPPQYQDREATYHALWQSLLRWLASNAGLLPGEQMALRTDRLSFNTAEPIEATLLMRDGENVPEVELRGGSLERPQVVRPVPVGEEPGAFRVGFGKLPEGRYEARVRGTAADDVSGRASFDVRQFIDEQLDLTARPDLMNRIARATGGATLETTDPTEIAGRFRSHLEINRQGRVLRRPAWDRWWVMAAVLTLWATTWLVRRFQGLT